MDFNKYFQKDIEFKQIDRGITNTNFVTNNGYIIKKYSNLVKNNEILLYHLVKEFDTEILLINEEVKITTFHKDGKTLEDEAINEGKVLKIANIVKKLHNKAIKTNVIFSPQEIINDYLKGVKKPLFNYSKYQHLVKKAQKIYPAKKDLILCHNDLTPGNFLFTNKKLYLIDWEYAGLNDPLFDVVSFLNENNLYDTKYKKIFIKEYFGNNEIPWEKIEIWNNFQNLMWAIWANMMYDANPKQIYLDIWEYKIKNLKNHL